MPGGGNGHMDNQKHSALKKTLTWEPSLRIVGWAAVAMLLLFLVPLLLLAFYAVPWYDDFNYGLFARAGMDGTPGILGALKGAWECARVQWYAWQGTFSSVFFMALTPVIWGERYYVIGSVFLILMLAASVFVLFGALTKKVLHADGISALGLQAVAAGMVIELIHTSQQGFYWYNGGVHYVGMHSFAMFFVAVLIYLSSHEESSNGDPKGRKRWKGILLVIAGMLLALLAGGGNFVTTLQGLLFLCSLMSFFLVTDRKKVLRFLPVFAVYVFAFRRNVSAPGNAVRARFFVGCGYSPLESVLRSFQEAFSHLWTFTWWMTLAVMVLLVPIIWKIVRKSSFSFRLPGLFLVWSICLYAAGFTPSLYSLGHAGFGRTLNAVKITYQILLLSNEVYFLGWLQGVLAQKGELPVWEGGCPWWFYGLMGACMIVIWRYSPNQAGWYSSYGAYYYMRTGEAQGFYAEYLQRIEILRGPEEEVVFAPYHYRPWLLCVGDLSGEPEREENRAVAAWYDKASVRVDDAVSP